MGIGKPKLLHDLRRFRRLLTPSLPLVRSIHSQNPNSVIVSYPSLPIGQSDLIERSQPWMNASLIGLPNSMWFRPFSIHTASSDKVDKDVGLDVRLETELEQLDANGDAVGVIGSNEDGEGLLSPVRAVISLLDGYHDLTGLACVITVPPPFPPPFSGKSYIKQFLLFRTERHAIGCPSYLWFLASFSVQVPCFLLWMTSVRRMSLDHHPGFDCGGILWFQNLTELPHGVFGSIFPILIASLHFMNVQISFRTSTVGKATGLFGLLAKYYKLYLQILTLPIFVMGYCVPQGSLIYWVTNSSLSVIQQLSLNHPAIRNKLGLPEKDALVKSETSGNLEKLEIRSLDTLVKNNSVKSLSPYELLALSIQLLTKGDKDRAIALLRMALEKDPEYIRALVVLGQTLMQKGLLLEAIEHFEHAISKLLIVGHPTDDENIDLLILSSSWAGVTYIRQGRNEEGIEHLERIAKLKEPEDPKCKAHYFDGLLLLASALLNEGRKSEAEKLLQMAAAYNPAYNEYLQQCREDS
ncbi:PREDICTED: ALBINO3-like protein 2, chloroplastic isoform X2 [Nelumbo nucifera]|uniref:ALBINO3-like protein 2, chloroplastic isoform X2 n=1 Tax=Nelumbo nucifera TaxID=4432 RepID=A0A1U7ZAD3_NELNU|nr:PREDICTED: ALBINO3-like protein 2, chloroplastic isoform X2 [Nelumbo nucifera]